MLRFEAVREWLRETFWVWPVVTSLVAVGCGIGLVHVSSPEWFVLLDVTESSIVGVLATLLAGMITATSVVSSLTIVALQTASEQFSPRLLRNFLRDRTTKVVLSTFVGTCSFIATILVARGADGPPRLAATVGVIAFVVSVVTIAIFFNHVSQSIRIESILRSIQDETCGAVGRLSAWTASSVEAAADAGRPPQQVNPVASTRTGYLQQVDQEALVRLAERHGVQVRIAAELGQSVKAGVPIAWWSPDGDDGRPSRSAETAQLSQNIAGLERGINSAIELGHERTMHHDVALGIRQLVDIAIKAMSPAVNDPYTAMQAVDHAGPILAQLSRCRLGGLVFADGDGLARVVMRVPTFLEFAAFACDQIRRYGSREPAVAIRLMEMLCDVGFIVDDEGDRAGLRSLIDLVEGEALNEATNAHDRRLVSSTGEQIRGEFDRGATVPFERRGGF